MSRKRGTTDTNEPKPKSSSGGQTFRRLAVVAGSRGALWAALALMAVTIILYYPMHGGDYDVWWHLRYGGHFVSDATWNVDHAEYSWTPVDTDWKYVTWLGSSALFLVHRIAGYAGLHLFLFAILAMTGLLYAVYIWSGGGRFRMAHAAFLLAAAIAVNPTAIYVKPELFTVLFFTAAVCIYFLSKRSGRRYFLLWPPLFLVWVNTHGAFLLGLVFVCAALVFETAAFLTRRSSALERPLLAWFAISVAASLAVTAVNPYGIAYPLETVLRLAGGDKGFQNIIMAYVNRWQFLFPDLYIFRRTNTAWALVLMMGTLAAAAVHAYRSRRFLDTAVLALNIAFFYFSMKLARAALFFPLIWLFSMDYILRRANGDSVYGKASLPSAAFVLAAAGVCFWNTATMNTNESRFGSRLDEYVPVREAAFMRERMLEGPIFNDYLSGGYILWALYPDYKAFIDPRHRPYEKTGVWDDYIGLRTHTDEESFRRFTEKYPFRSALVHHIQYGDIVQRFLQSPEWRLVHIGPVAAVFAHASTTAGVKGGDPVRDLSAERFEQLKNPSALMSLFRVYYLVSLVEAEKIMHIYRDNVCAYYVERGSDLATMNALLARTR